MLYIKRKFLSMGSISVISDSAVSQDGLQTDLNILEHAFQCIFAVASICASVEALLSRSSSLGTQICLFSK